MSISVCGRKCHQTPASQFDVHSSKYSLLLKTFYIWLCVVGHSCVVSPLRRGTCPLALVSFHSSECISEIAAQRVLAGWLAVHVLLFPSALWAPWGQGLFCFNLWTPVASHSNCYMRNNKCSERKEMNELQALCLCGHGCVCLLFELLFRVQGTSTGCTGQCCPVEVFAVMGYSMSVFSSTIVTGHMWPLTTCSIIRPRAWIKFNYKIVSCSW